MHRSRVQDYPPERLLHFFVLVRMFLRELPRDTQVLSRYFVWVVPLMRLAEPLFPVHRFPQEALPDSPVQDRWYLLLKTARQSYHLVPVRFLGTLLKMPDRNILLFGCSGRY